MSDRREGSVTYGNTSRGNGGGTWRGGGGNTWSGGGGGNTWRGGGGNTSRGGDGNTSIGRGGYMPRGGGFVNTNAKLLPSTDLLPHQKQTQFTNMNALWKHFPDEQQNIQIPVRTGEAKEFDKTICLRVNYFPLKVKLPADIYHYVVDITKVISDTKVNTVKQSKATKLTKQKENQSIEKKPLPRHIRFAIYNSLLEEVKREFIAANNGKSIGLISDRSTAIYSTQKLELSVSMKQHVEIFPETGEDGHKETFSVVLTPTIERIETIALQSILQNMKNVPVTPDLNRIDRVYNTLMKNLNSSRYVPIGRSSLICFDENTSRTLGGGLLNFKGYDATIEITNGWKPLLNVHIANCATLLNKNVIDVFADLFNMGKDSCRTTVGWTSKDFKLASDLLSSCKVKYFPLENMSKILGGTVTKVISQSVSTKTFILEEDGKKRKISIYDYFVERYGRKDLHKDGPCLELNSRNYVPAEICEVKKGQSINRKLTSDQTTAMINCSKKTPDVLQSEIEKSISNLNLPNDPVLKEFGVSFEKKVSLLELSETRILAAPELCYSQARVIPNNGVWDSFALKAKFLEPSEIHKWGLLYTCKGNGGKDLRQSQSFVEKLKEKASCATVQITTEPITLDLSEKMRDDAAHAKPNVAVLIDCFEKFFVGCQIVIVVIPAKVCHIYCHVKQAAELKIGMLTQCVTADSFNPKPNRADSIAGNIVLKINSKLGGINHTVVNPSRTIAFKIFEEPVVIIGADVTHGGSEEEGRSYAAVTCSSDRSGMPYMMHVQAQLKAGKGAAEIIENFDLIVTKCLINFRNSTGLKPRKIIYYRYGVGEGQFPEILHTEMRGIRKACSSLNVNYQPAITFVTVQKRHKTRFFMQKDGKASKENAPPGTVVDTVIVHTTENDFFLLSHQGIKGSTVRPTRYHVLWDDSDFSLDQIQQLTYYLCYMYVRCNRSVSIPAPTYYAHHAAARANVLCQGLSGTIKELNEQLLRTELNKKSPMHFV